MLAAADRRSWPTVFAETLGAEGPCVGERSSPRATYIEKPRQIQAGVDKYTVWQVFDIGWLREVECRRCPAKVRMCRPT
jgi:hypothetical protein